MLLPGILTAIALVAGVVAAASYIYVTLAAPGTVKVPRRFFPYVPAIPLAIGLTLMVVHLATGVHSLFEISLIAYGISLFTANRRTLHVMLDIDRAIPRAYWRRAAMTGISAVIETIALVALTGLDHSSVAFRLVFLLLNIVFLVPPAEALFSRRRIEAESRRRIGISGSPPKDPPLHALYLSLTNFFVRAIMPVAGPRAVAALLKECASENPLVLQGLVFTNQSSISIPDMAANLRVIEPSLRDEAVLRAFSGMNNDLFAWYGESTSRQDAKKLYEKCFRSLEEAHRGSGGIRKIVPFLPEGIAESEKARMAPEKDLRRLYTRKTRALDRLEGRFGAVFSYMKEAAILYDRELKLVGLNRAASVLFSTVGTDVSGKNIFEALPLDDGERERIGDTMDRILGGEEAVTATVRFNPRGKGERIFISTTTPIILDGELTGFAEFWHDMTEIRMKEKELEQRLQEKEMLLKEVHHRVKNNLQVIISLINLQNRAETDPRTAALLTAFQNRVRTMAIIYEKLSMRTDLSRLDFSSYIPNLVGNILQSCAVGPDAIKVSCEIEKIEINLSTAIPVGMMVNELVSNAVKYGFPDGARGQVTISLRRDPASGRFCLLVADDGIGMPEGFDAAASGALGLQIVQALAQQVNGELSINPPSRKGTRFTITFNEIG
jgi:PAS domain S-box-containing protein